ncbi:hypothetical protein TrCOL_g8189 [Triparma columacea]|uniref:Uncharacterized protein n=1 Tax=Triparma columacea TaxID=722753 RepID=A0A9W7L901_9STRA|nr:hypothetical protein TrCOL_g8189 [Triparma columacea]
MEPSGLCWDDEAFLQFCALCIETKGNLPPFSRNYEHNWTLSYVDTNSILNGSPPNQALSNPHLTRLANFTHYARHIPLHGNYPFKGTEMKYIAKAMKGFDGSFKFSQLNKAKLKAALEERFTMTFGVSSQESEWVAMRKREYIRRAFARIPSGITDKVEGRIEVFISGMLNKVTTQTSSELGKKTLTEVGEQNTLMKGIKIVAARFWTHDSKSGDLAVAFLRMILAKMKEGGLGGADLEQFAAEFEKLYGDKAERIKFDGQDVGEKRKNEGTANGREISLSHTPGPSDKGEEEQRNGSLVEESRNMAAHIAVGMITSSVSRQQIPANTALGSSGGGGGVKSEPSRGEDAISALLSREPLSDREFAIVSRLTEMGFPKLESIQGCRAAARKFHHGMYPSNCSIVVDEAMCLIVEEMEEKTMTVMMDRARVESERENDRREEERREREKEERKKERGGRGDTVDQLIQTFGSSSVILRSPCSSLMKASLSDGTRKASCIRILNLERNAQRWYGVNCRAYFLATLPQRVERMGGTKEAWEEEVRILEKAMFSLSEAGGGGTPRIFEDAQDTCGEQRGATEVAGEGEDAEVVIVKKPEVGTTKESKMKEALIIEIE